MKKFLQDLIAKKKAELQNLQERSNKSEDLNEVRSIGTQIDSVNQEIREAQTQLNAIELEEKDADNSNKEKQAEQRSANGFDPSKALNVVASAQMNAQNENRSSDDALSTMEYRKEFMGYAKTGVRSDKLNSILATYKAEKRAAGEVTSEELGVLIPHTVLQELIKKLEKSYGMLSSRVRMLNIPGGVEVPIGDFEAEFTWCGSKGDDKEHGVSDEQGVEGVTGSVTFSYHIGEIRISQSLLQSILTVDLFEKELVNALFTAYLKARDHAVLTGTGSGQPTGILTNVAAGLQRIPTSHIIEFTDEEMADWTSWQKKLFAEIPLGMESETPEFAMAKQTYSGNLCTLKDTTNQPIKKAGYDTSDNTHKFNDYAVIRTEKDLFKPFDECANGEFFGMFWVPEKAYAINSNMTFGYKKYFDDDKNKWITKGLVILDGKPLNTEYIYLLKKKIVTTTNTPQETTPQG